MERHKTSCYQKFLFQLWLIIFVICIGYASGVAECMCKYILNHITISSITYLSSYIPNDLIVYYIALFILSICLIQPKQLRVLIGVIHQVDRNIKNKKTLISQNYAILLKSIVHTNTVIFILVPNQNMCTNLVNTTLIYSIVTIYLGLRPRIKSDHIEHALFHSS